MSDWLIYLFIFIGVIVGYLFGYFSGVVNGYNYAQDEKLKAHPIRNIEMYESEDKFNFVDMVTGDFIMRGTVEECIELLHKTDDEQKLVFSKGPSE